MKVKFLCRFSQSHFAMRRWFLYHGFYFGFNLKMVLNSQSLNNQHCYQRSRSASTCNGNKRSIYYMHSYIMIQYKMQDTFFEVDK